MPSCLYKSNYHLTNGDLKYFHPKTIKRRTIKEILKDDYKFGKKNLKNIEVFMLKMLTWDKKQRTPAHELLLHNFMKT